MASLVTQPPGPAQTTCRVYESVRWCQADRCHLSFWLSIMSGIVITYWRGPALWPNIINYKELHHTGTIISPDMCSSAPLSVGVASDDILRIFPIFQHKAGQGWHKDETWLLPPPPPYLQILADWGQVWIIQQSSARVRGEIRAETKEQFGGQTVYISLLSPVVVGGSKLKQSI